MRKPANLSSSALSMALCTEEDKQLMPPLNQSMQQRRDCHNVAVRCLLSRFVPNIILYYWYQNGVKIKLILVNNYSKYYFVPFKLRWAFICCPLVSRWRRRYAFIFCSLALNMRNCRSQSNLKLAGNALQYFAMCWVSCFIFKSFLVFLLTWIYSVSLSARVF